MTFAAKRLRVGCVTLRRSRNALAVYMKEKLKLVVRRVILWACPEILSTFLTREARLGFVNAAKLIASNDVRGEEDSALCGITSPGAHASHATLRASGKSAGHSVPGAHVWVLAALALTTLCAHTRVYAQQGGQASSTTLTGTGAPGGNCGVGSLYVNTATGDLYDCNAGAWNKVNGGGGSAFTGGLGTSFQDVGGISAPANPASGNGRLYFASADSLFHCVTSSGANCFPAGGAGTVTQVTSGNFSPLFNVSVATNTTTPAFSFAGISQTQNLFFASPNGASGNPSFRALVAADVPASANSCAMHQFTISLASGLSVTCAQPVAADIGSIPGSSGQLLFNNAGAIGAEDPIVSYAYINLFNAIAATATQTSSTVRVSTFGQYGTLIVTWASITGSPSGCTIQLRSADSLGNLTNNGSAVAVAPANGTSAILFTPSIYTAAQMQAVYSCSAYPSTGTLSLDFVPSVTVYDSQGPAGSQSSPWWVRPTDGTNNMPMGDASARSIHETIDNADVPTNLAQVNGNAVSTAANGVQKVGIVGNAGAAVDAAIGAAPPANAIQVAGLGSGLTGGEMISPAVADTPKVINISTATTTLIVTGVSGRQVRIGSMILIAAGADNVALIEGSGATCGTGTAGMAGGTTAASGFNLVANQGYTFGSGLGTVFETATAGDSVCIVTSAAVQLSGTAMVSIY